MSLQENIDYVKKEISAEETFMESFFKLEKFYKKYKIVLFAIIAIVIAGTIGYYVNNYFQMQNKIKANEAFNTLLLNPSDTDALNTLKQHNEKLYNIVLFTQNKPLENNVEFLTTLFEYSLAIKENSIDKITSTTQNQNFLLKDFALLNKAILQTQNGDYAAAKETTALISESSELATLAKMLSHFLLSK